MSDIVLRETTEALRAAIGRAKQEQYRAALRLDVVEVDRQGGVIARLEGLLDHYEGLDN